MNSRRQQWRAVAEAVGVAEAGGGAGSGGLPARGTMGSHPYGRALMSSMNNELISTLLTLLFFFLISRSSAKICRRAQPNARDAGSYLGSLFIVSLCQ